MYDNYDNREWYDYITGGKENYNQSTNQSSYVIILNAIQMNQRWDELYVNASTGSAVAKAQDPCVGLWFQSHL